MRSRFCGFSHLLSFALGGLFSSFLLLLFQRVPRPFDDKQLSNNKYNNDDQLTNNESKTGYSSSAASSILVVILSSPDQKESRSSMRESWLGFVESPDQFLFAVGVTGVTREQRANLIREQEENGDILLLDFVESYRNLTGKLILTLRHVSNSFSFTYLLKADVDTFVNFPSLKSELENLPRERLYMGYFQGQARIKKRGKWRESEWFLSDRYLPYALGGAYIISSDLVKFVVTNSRLLQSYMSEDVSLGTWLSPLKLTRKHDPRFDTGDKSRGCSSSYLALHKRRPDEILAMASRLRRGLPLCEVERVSSPAYTYDWSVIPSQCCSKIPGNVL